MIPSTPPRKPPSDPASPRERWLARMTPRQRQFALLAAIVAAGVALLWIVFSFSESATTSGGGRQPAAHPDDVTNIGVMPPGGQVNALDQWVGQAGRKLAQYESEREEQGRQNKDRQAFEARTMQRFAELEQRLLGSVNRSPPPTPAPPAPQSQAEPPYATVMPPQQALPVRPAPAAPLGPPPPSSPLTGSPVAVVVPRSPSPVISRVSLGGAPARPIEAAAVPSDTAAGAATNQASSTVSTFLPVSFTRGILLGGLDAPTGGQSQSNPHPVLIRLSDNSVLPNQFRGEYVECFVVAAGYGDISSERAYLRTENLSCVRADGATLEVRIQGSIYGEDGKVGMRGRLVTKQGQMLANALLAGVVSGIGQGLSTANTSYSSSPLGTVASTDSSADAYRAGLGSGVGKALDRLAQYYIKLAENTFPVIEVDAGRQIDVVITKGVRIEVPMTSTTQAGARRAQAPQHRYLEPTDDHSY
ncbi:TrbI/VirB10 family protein [Pseudorhodoferax soli]|uniref:Conjugal transfer pilus assembly protein TraB n=1 Tax=Pseudorhodoferax soli TaxID=545864 RepID=A0A368XBK5_9BURK|nr:TrbI/VirB10 family protein [Pseudorhodoferax soli]RCW65099.1 conjugal transfer pilus assembly protein TraB [Pseudorhodoferax soli]